MSRFLFGLGLPIRPPIERLLRAGDYTAKYDVLSQIMHFMPRPTADGLRPEIERLTQHPDAGDRREQVDAIAVEVLDWLDDADR